MPVLQFDDADAFTADGGGDAGPCIATGPEICDDGIDNDCNGQTDCADVACTPRWTCTAAPPDQWTPVGFAAATRVDCPVGFGAPTDLQTVAGKSGAPVCDCDCGGANACAPGGIVMTAGNTPACNDASQTFPNADGCQKISGGGLSLTTNSYVKANAGTPGSCNVSAAGTFAPLSNGRTCGIARLGGGCKANQVCVPRPGTAFQSCVEKTGNVACPGGYPTLYQAGDSAADTRACTACTCTTAPCAGTLELFDDTACTASANLEISAAAPPGTCAKGKNTAFAAKSFTVAMSGGCVMAAAGKGTGTLTFQDEETICCR